MMAGMEYTEPPPQEAGWYHARQPDGTRCTLEIRLFPPVQRVGAEPCPDVPYSNVVIADVLNGQRGLLGVMQAHGWAWGPRVEHHRGETPTEPGCYAALGVRQSWEHVELELRDVGGLFARVVHGKSPGEFPIGAWRAHEWVGPLQKPVIAFDWRAD